jgi:hypothetical protein
LTPSLFRNLIIFYNERRDTNDLKRIAWNDFGLYSVIRYVPNWVHIRIYSLLYQIQERIRMEGFIPWNKIFKEALIWVSLFSHMG